jgi:hypothetical protein
MRRAFAIAVLSAATVAGATVAEAASPGTFTGKTTAGDPLGFKVDGSGRVYSFFFEGVRLDCSDKDRFDTSTGSARNQSPSKSRYRVGSKRRFTISFTSTKTGFGWTAKGRFASNGRSATGTLRVLARFDDTNNLAPKGTIKCDSGQLKWTAKHA